MNFSSEEFLDEQVMDINITPLIDVVFLLLIFFMVTTTFIDAKELDVSLPKTSSQQQTKSNNEFSVSIEKSGVLRYRGEIVQEKQIADIVSERLKTDPNLTLIIRADEQVSHGKVVTVMDLAQSKGIQRVAIATAAAE